MDFRRTLLMVADESVTEVEKKNIVILERIDKEVKKEESQWKKL